MSASTSQRVFVVVVVLLAFVSYAGMRDTVCIRGDSLLLGFGRARFRGGSG